MGSGLDTYQFLASKTAIWNDEQKRCTSSYLALGLNGEAGEVAERIKKQIREGVKEGDSEKIAYELGDCLWYLSMLALEIGYDLSEIADMNIKKLEKRYAEGKLHGSGSSR